MSLHLTVNEKGRSSKKKERKISGHLSNTFDRDLRKGRDINLVLSQKRRV